MYKITKQSVFTFFKIKDGIDPNLNLSYYEIELRNTKQYELNLIVFFQDNIPNCETKYWKIENNIVIEMSVSEKQYVDNLEIYEAKKIEFKGKRYRITVSTLSAEDTGFMYVFTRYPFLPVYCNTQESIFTDISYDTLVSYAYLDIITDYFLNIINTDNRFVKEDVESYNPNN
jgi:hypothetical protein